MKNLICILICILALPAAADTITVAKAGPISTVKRALAMAKDGDVIIVKQGTYREGNILVNKSVTLLGKDYPVLDGQGKYEVLSLNANAITVNGFRVINSGFAALKDPCGIRIYDRKDIIVCNNILNNNFFGIYVQNGSNCIIKNNTVTAYGKEEQLIGNGIHCWKSQNLQITGNRISGHRDGIYFEFVTNSVIWRNISFKNIRYGLHFMFSNNDAYISNVFRNNGAGVAVMFTKNVKMYNNFFGQNWGDSAYGLLLKEIADSYIFNNRFSHNTTGIYMEGTSRITMEKNSFEGNGWGMKIQASCMDNTLESNNFMGNTFDVSTNGTLVLNTFSGNYWDKYEGYDLDKDGVGDVPFHPLSLFAVLTENNPPAMLLFRSFMITLLDKSEKVLPSITPGNFEDAKPLMKPLPL